MKQSITAAHIEGVCRLYDHDEHCVRDSQRSRHAAIAKEIMFQIVALTRGFINLHNEVCKGLVWVSTTNLSLINDFTVPVAIQGRSNGVLCGLFDEVWREILMRA